MAVRRIVTGVDERGRAVVLSDGPSPRAHDFVHMPSHSMSLLWGTDGVPPLGAPTVDPAPGLPGAVPAPGGTVFMVVTLPPRAVLTSDDYDPGAARSEQMAFAPDLYARFEKDNPGFHATPTVDYVIVLNDELTLELDDGSLTQVRAGDVVVQNGNRHAWRNNGAGPVSFACVLLGAGGASKP